jgi:hypothetical protein
MEIEGNILNLRQVSIRAFHKAVDTHLSQRGEEFVPVAVFINRRATSFYFLSQSIEKAGQAVFDVIWPLNNDSQISKPALVQSANMIEVHYVFEDEAAAGLHFVPKNQSGLQGLAIIDLSRTCKGLVSYGSYNGVSPLLTRKTGHVWSLMSIAVHCAEVNDRWNRTHAQLVLRSEMVTSYPFVCC